MHIINRSKLNKFLKVLPLELWYMIMEECVDEWWTDASLCIAMGLNFHDLPRLQWVNKTVFTCLAQARSYFGRGLGIII